MFFWCEGADMKFMSKELLYGETTLFETETTVTPSSLTWCVLWEKTISIHCTLDFIFDRIV